MTRLEKYRQRHALLTAQARTILDAAGEDGQLSADQQKDYDGLKGQLATVVTSIQREQELTTAERQAPAVAAAAGDGGAEARAVRDIRFRAEHDPQRGFASHHEFLRAVMANTGLRNRAEIADERLRPLAVGTDKDDDKNAPSGEIVFLLPRGFTPRSLLGAAGSDEQGTYDDRYGGAAVPRVLLPGMLSLGFEGDPTAGRTQPLPMDVPSVSILARTDKDHSSSVSGGLVVTRKPETVAATASRMATELVTLKATSLFGLNFQSEELITDSPTSFIALVAAGMRDQYAMQIFREKLRGVGGNEFLGILTALESATLGPTVTIAKESGQAAATIVAQNAMKMRAQCYRYGQAIWLANHDCYPQLATLAVPVGTGGTLVYQQSIQEDRPDMLLGRPIFYTEFASTLGTIGDLICAVWVEYLEGTYQALQSAESMHVRFLEHERAFKFWLRNAGAPWWRVPLTPNQSTKKLSPFVVLATRS